MGSKRKRRRAVVVLPDDIGWWIPRPGAELQGTVERVLVIPDEFGRDKHAVIVLRPDGGRRLIAIPDCVRSRSIAQAIPVGARLLVTYHGWQPNAAGRMHRDIRIHVGSIPEVH